MFNDLTFGYTKGGEWIYEGDLRISPESEDEFDSSDFLYSKGMRGYDLDHVRTEDSYRIYKKFFHPDLYALKNICYVSRDYNFYISFDPTEDYFSMKGPLGGLSFWSTKALHRIDIGEEGPFAEYLRSEIISTLPKNIFCVLKGTKINEKTTEFYFNVAHLECVIIFNHKKIVRSYYGFKKF